jgi:hypothetical protein
MHRKIDELIKSAGFQKENGLGTLDSLFRPGASSPGQDGSTSPLESLSPNNVEFTSSDPQVPIQTNTNPTSSSNGIGSALSGAAGGLIGGGGGILEGLFGGGLLGDLFSGLSGLFGGGQSQPPTPVQYEAPQSQDFELAMEGGQVGNAVYNQQGIPQIAPASDPAISGLQYLGALGGGNGSVTSNTSGGSGSGSGSQSAPQITLNVQAMDSQSFLDRSQDIAQAVRQAMLNMHSINDVINDL